MSRFLTLTDSNANSKVVHSVANTFSTDLAAYASLPSWMIPRHQTARHRVMQQYMKHTMQQSMRKSYKWPSTVMYDLVDDDRDMIGYALIVNHNINAANSINEENEYFAFLTSLFTILKHVLLLPLRIGFVNAFAMLLFYFHHHLYHNIIMSNLRKAIQQTKSSQQQQQSSAPQLQRSSFNTCTEPNIVELNHVMIASSHRRQKKGTQFVQHLLRQIYDGYDDCNDDAPTIYVHCDQQSLLFWRRCGFEMIGVIDSAFYRRKHTQYSLIYHRNIAKLSAIANKAKQLFTTDSTVDFALMNLSFDFNDNNNMSNIHFKWTFPVRNMMDIVVYLFKFGWISFVIGKIEQIIDFDSSQITNWTLCRWVLCVCCVGTCFLFCLPLLLITIILRKFKIGAWDL